MQTAKLNKGVEMPVLGFAVFQIQDAEVGEQSVLDAIGTGYRLIDTAVVCLNEGAVGKAIKRSGVRREEFFITTKLWIQDTGHAMASKSFSPENEPGRLKDGNAKRSLSGTAA